ncbi:hypothetical protein [Streptosporangium sp. NPDC049644]|uniref:hypothetical protein n=1 Tax=Streptosporangium sp. NPDC049644 TaxID=3155507 RepID=UPI00341E78A7
MTGRLDDAQRAAVHGEPAGGQVGGRVRRQVDADIIAEPEATYRRLDGKNAGVVAVSIWRTRDDGLITDHRIFVDLAPVHLVQGPHALHPDSTG